jgi:hypothetical protein
MAKRVAVSTLQASTIDILNVIRQNASYDYQQNVPAVTKASDIPKVGEIIYGTPAFANQFLNALVNRIALVRVNSATFNNPYAALKKGFLEFGETIEEIFVNIAKVVDYSAEKGEARELKRTLPDVRSAFHAMNWRVMYPVTIQDEDLRLAFLNEGGVTTLIAKIVDSIYTAAEYDEYLLFKYLLIKAVSHGKMYPLSVGTDADLHVAAEKYRGISNLLTFMKKEYNASGVQTTTPKERQAIFMDAMYNAKYDVNVLASAFNMDKATFMGNLHLIDDWTTFDNDRFNVIRANSDGLEEVTAAELALMKDVKAVMVDTEWFQVYDNNAKFTEKYVASGLYWNYFYHVWKTISSSPFSNAVAFVTDTATITLPDTITVKVTAKDISEDVIVLTLNADADGASLKPNNTIFAQTKAMVNDGVAMHKYGAIMIPADKVNIAYTLEVYIKDTLYTATGSAITTNAIHGNNNVGYTLTLTKQ